MGDQTSEVEELERVFTDTTSEPIKISYAAIKYITKNFAQRIGDGGFGVVYLGGLRNGMVAVKKLVISRNFSDKQFLDEVTCLRKVKHSNIVRFLGYCADTQGEVMEVEGKLKIVEVPQRLLCFEYVPNGNLQHYLEEKTHGYEWDVHYQIIRGICQGLNYIHEEHINHLDLKPANVLLGANMEPKITDFGVSRFTEEQSTMVTANIFGTLGYVAPEFIDNHQISSKSDIYSLGVIMINIFTGRIGGIVKDWKKAIDVHCPEMETCIKIAESCVHKDPHKRPTMGEIIKTFGTETIIQNDHTSQTYKPIINEPRNDPKSSLHKVVQRFQALPTETHKKHSRVDTLYAELDVPECLLEGTKKPGKVSHELLLFITGNFSREREIGRGTFANVYKGILRQRCVAVKRLLLTIDFDDRKFRHQIKTMMLAQHKNVVQFLGYCSYTEDEAIERQGELVMVERREKLLCFEYLSKKSLSGFLSDASCGFGWRKRYQIIKGICEGLHYLHGKDIVHMDLKPTNILLDDSMDPKITDYGVLRCFDENQRRVITQEYLAPEFMVNKAVSFKCDIYALGVTITEILGGRIENRFVIEEIIQSWKNTLLLHVSPEDTVLLVQLTTCAEISRACTAHDPNKRPDTGRIMEMLLDTEREEVLSNSVYALYMELDNLECILEGSKKPDILSYKLIWSLTGGFPPEREIGRSRFAITYRGILRQRSVDGKRQSITKDIDDQIPSEFKHRMLPQRSVAVKRLSMTSEIDDIMFHNEMKTLMSAQHENIVQFIGYCSYTQQEAVEHLGNFVMADTGGRLLCLEHLSNGSLEDYVSDISSGLNWRARYQIIKGICEGLHYLHRKSIVHGRLKPANILLDDNMVPKIADFGLSRCFGENKARTYTSKLSRSKYMAPEFFWGVMTLKSDIYSLGVTIIEILIGHKGVEIHGLKKKGGFEIQKVLESWEKRLVTSSPDTVLLEQVRVCAEISRACIAYDPYKRPDTGRIINMLHGKEMDGAGALSKKVNDTLSIELGDLECILEGSKQPGIQSYQLLQFITDNFSPQLEICRSGFTITYWGILRKWSIAVKRLSMTIYFNDRMFHEEIKHMMFTQHKNIVQFLGYCSYTQKQEVEYPGEFVMADMGERLLCFEYLSKGSLDRHVSDASWGLEWIVRYQIIMGICEGLHYLHGEKIVHGDLRPTKILLDDNMVPKIADFGLSRCFDENQAQSTTQSPIGSGGYMAPENMNTGVITFKSDIYSLGVTIAEILTGLRRDFAIEYVLESWKNRFLQTSPAEIVLLEQVRVCAEISRACMAYDPDKRPDTGHIMEMLLETEPKRVDFTFYTEPGDLECILEGSKKPGILSYQLLRSITRDFTPEREIGRSESVTTYKGILRFRSLVVKRLCITMDFDDQMFNNEIKTLMSVQHKNIVQFLGCCSYTQQEPVECQGKFITADIPEKLLCFEYLGNGSLKDYVSDASSGLDWRERYQIIKGICEGLCYLHRKCIVHGRLKPANILLDDNMVPKIADFGLSRCFDEYKARTYTSKLSRSLGYLAPEFYMGVITMKSDIYSLGVTITEMLTGQKGYFKIDEVLESWKKRLGTSFPNTVQLEQVRVCAKISMACIDIDPETRPCIQHILEMLNVIKQRRTD